MKKGKEDTFTSVPVGKIVSESNRKHGGTGNIEILSESIKAEGLINPPTVIANEDGTYRVIAGRRRIEAVRQLKWKAVPVRVIDEADADRLEAIALSENVNRQEMHPLDEAETFKKLLDKGTDIKDVAALYDRSISGIHHRVRLCSLQDELKEMFREGKINLSGAALLASLPAEDQAKFAKKFEKKGTVGTWEIASFIHQVQHCLITLIADKQCEKCKKRTRNSTPGLFEDFRGLEDVCFDQDCYAGKWKKLIEGLIARENTRQTENNIILASVIPRFLPGKEKTLTLGETEYNLIPPQNHSWSETSKKTKQGTAWLVTAPYNSTDVKVQRVAYEAFERQSYDPEPSDPVKEYLIDHVPDVAAEDRKAVAEKVKEKFQYSWRLTSKVKENLLDAIIAKRIKEENRVNLVAEYLKARRSGEDESGAVQEIDPEYAGIFETIFGPDGITAFSDIPAEPIIQKVFLFIIATGCISGSDMPDLNDSDDQWAEAEKSLFWKFAQLERDEYVRMYREILAGAVKAVTQKPGREETAPEETGEEAPEEGE